MNFDWKKHCNEFFRPKMNRAFFIRLGIVAAAAFVFFKFICLPMFLDGGSMEPNYHSGTLNFCWTPSFWFSKPKRGDVVALKYAGDEIMLLKRIVALPGETVEFRKGVLYVNGRPLDEPYVQYRREPWNLELRTVRPGHVYVVGDNRSMPIYQHKFGEIASERIRGKLLL